MPKKKPPIPDKNQPKINRYFKPASKEKQPDENQPSQNSAVNNFSQLNLGEPTHSSENKNAKRPSSEVNNAPTGFSPVKKSAKTQDEMQEESLPPLEPIPVSPMGFPMESSNNQASTQEDFTLKVESPNPSTRELATQLLKKKNYKFLQQSLSNISNFQNSMGFFADNPVVGKFPISKNNNITRVDFFADTAHDNPPGSKVPAFICKNPSDQLLAIIICGLDTLFENEKKKQIKAITEMGLHVMVVVDESKNKFSLQTDKEWLNKMRGLVSKPGNNEEANFPSLVQVIYKTTHGKYEHTSVFTREKLFKNQLKLDKFTTQSKTTTNSNTSNNNNHNNNNITTTSKSSTSTTTNKFSFPLFQKKQNPKKAFVDLTNETDDIQKTPLSAINASLTEILIDFNKLLNNLNIQNLPIEKLKSIAKKADSLRNYIEENYSDNEEAKDLKKNIEDTATDIKEYSSKAEKILILIKKYAKEIHEKFDPNMLTNPTEKTEKKLLELLTKNERELNDISASENSLAIFFGFTQKFDFSFKEIIDGFLAEEDLATSLAGLSIQDNQQNNDSFNF